ncbi:hypothetical protein HYH03_017954 [Edaphochlamys debaryana]|uniref:Ankyrin repeat domain-containing protein n=1 Tax=Edaphochlamys debaryana TaxID=47281 RepID=A0A836BNS9_9CHLO|nr:hypothetical protein HYH03_017954 [Edaphochlamys debaryana]|eukprot:KAG2483162.1 hypothetical protein HYH03_017954 [Edaphochlamys debaryana]
MSPPSDPVADVWRSPELLGCVAPFLDPSHAAWSFIRANKAAAAAAYGDSGQPVPRTVSLGRESLEGAVVAAGLSPPPLKVLVAAASAGRLGVCRWLVEGLGCPGLHRLACLCLISAAGPGPGVVEEARAWLAPAALEGWSEEQEAQAAGGDLGAVSGVLRDSQTREGANDSRWPWQSAFGSLQDRRYLEQPPNGWSYFSAASPEFYRGPHAALAVARLAHIESGRQAYTAMTAAAEAGHVEAVRCLLSRGARPDARWPDLPASAAACNGHLLRALPELLGSAAPGWDRCRGACWANAAASGCEEAVEWLAKEAGVPQESRQDTYRGAASQGDLRMVQRLRRLGCPYSARDAEALAEAARRVPASAAALPWLQEPGCPVSWGAAAAEARAEADAHARARAEAEARAKAEAEAEEEWGVQQTRCCCVCS